MNSFPGLQMPLVAPAVVELGCTNELGAVAAGLAVSGDDYAEADLEQRTLCGNDDGHDGCGLAVEDMKADKESNGGDAASGEGEDAALKPSNAPRLHRNRRSAQPLTRGG